MYSRFGHMRNDIENVVEQIGEQIGTFFEQVRKEAPFTAHGTQPQVFTPRIDVEEDAAHVYVLAELPGMEKSDINIRIRVTPEGEKVLTIRGEKKQQAAGPEVRRVQSERRFGDFFRSVNLPEQANTEQINAEFTSGILKITIAKNAEADNEIKVEIH